MTPVRFALAAVVLYAAFNVLVERKLSHLPPLLIMSIFYLGIPAVVVPSLVLSHQAHGIQLSRTILTLLFAAGILLAIADFCFFSAFHAGGRVLTVTTIIALMPVAASAIKALVGGGWPSPLQLVGWLFAFAAVLLVSRSS